MKALITGGSRGIGKATVEQFKKNGYEVIAPTREELNLLNPKSVENFINSMLNIQIDTIINNAGINDITLLENATDIEIERMLMVDLISPMKLLRGLIPSLRNSKAGRIVNIGSIWAVVSKSSRSLYSVAKNGIHGMSNTLALELCDSGILVNTVCPGFTLTELTIKNNTPEQISEIEKGIPLNRMAHPEEIAKLVYFLGSTENTYITGQKICIDGGFTVQ